MKIRGQDSTYFLKNVRSVFEQIYVYLFANLEGPLTTSRDHAEKTFAFQGKT